ncbi:MAG TPA: hypothetical protein DHV16_04495 [Nitrospiraceae bacterium]|nr:MAG: hypothetical protein A2Z82_09275 [Nitrospirae bacterium GWA2_46_11]OGW24987.1 MAG: hypothetical protein A2X55_05950 [Nitrospirae bacterium GWB2_47_37]HAK88783.1 hypothetical protein [Nitrospiraceae bacterium]HCZ11508.1 hypothetical protein [Nitrospiraceae bacterium]
MTIKKILSSKIIFIPAVFCLAILHSNTAYSADWRLYSENQHFSFYYSAEETDPLNEFLSVFKKKIVKIKMWTKHAVKNDKGRDRRILENKNLGLSVKDYEHYEYTLSLKEINCSDKMIRSLSEADYTKEGNLLERSESPFAGWNPVVPASGDESLYKAVCTFPEAEKR